VKSFSFVVGSLQQVSRKENSRSMAQVTPRVDTSFLGWSTIPETKLNDGGRHRRPSGWGKDARASNDGDLTAGNWRLHQILSGWGVTTTLETKQLGIGDVAGDLAAGEWKQQ